MDEYKKGSESGFDMRNQLLEEVSNLITKATGCIGDRDYPMWFHNTELIIPYMMAYKDSNNDSLIDSFDSIAKEWKAWAKNNRYKCESDDTWSGVPLDLHKKILGVHMDVLRECRKCGFFPSTEKTKGGQRG